jgi:Invasion associated locus B (IalB) protein
VHARAAYRLVKRPLCVLVAVGLCVASAALGEADASELIYSPREKHCISADVSLIEMDVRLASGCKLIVAGALFVERTGESNKTLRIGLPNYVRSDDGVRISFDQGAPVQLPFVRRHDYGSVADYEAGAELVDQLKRGTTLVIEATSARGVSMTYRLSLGGFAAAYDGPGTSPPELVESPKKLQEELLRRQEGLPQPRASTPPEFVESQKKLQEGLWRRNRELPQPRFPENHKAGCEADGK